MYQKNDLIMYGGIGVCRVEELVELEEDGKKKRYYRLSPLYHSEVIYTPVEQTKIKTRPIISAEEAERLIDEIPSRPLEKEDIHSRQQKDDFYRGLTRDQDCGDLIELAMRIHTQRKDAAEKKRRLGQMEERYGRQAEELLYGEFAAALGIPKESVEAYIARRVAKMKEDTEEQ